MMSIDDSIAHLASSRREWLGGVIALGLGAIGADTPVSKPVAPKVRAADIESIRKHTKDAGLANFQANESAHYVAVGNAPEGYRKEALQVCEEIASSFLTHFRGKKFKVEFPSEKMPVVTLKDRASYEAFKGEDVDPTEGGHFDVTEGRLVIFDFRGGDSASPVFNPQRLNTFSLVHESIHQLTFATGILERNADVPVAISEGFATQGELWKKTPVSDRVMGQLNRPRLWVLRTPGNDPAWIGLAELLTEDDLFENAKTSQVAYAQSWLLIYEMLRSQGSLARLNAYLDKIKTRRNAGKRVADAEDSLGNLATLDRELKQAALKLLRSNPPRRP